MEAQSWTFIRKEDPDEQEDEEQENWYRNALFLFQQYDDNWHAYVTQLRMSANMQRQKIVALFVSLHVRFTLEFGNWWLPGSVTRSNLHFYEIQLLDVSKNGG